MIKAWIFDITAIPWSCDDQMSLNLHILNKCADQYTHTHTHICIPLCRGINAAVTKMRGAADCIQQLWHKFVSMRVWHAAWLHMTVNARLILMMLWTPITLLSCNYAGTTQTGAQRLLERTFSTVWLWKPALSVSLTQSYCASAVYSQQRKLVWSQFNSREATSCDTWRKWTNEKAFAGAHGWNRVCQMHQLVEPVEPRRREMKQLQECCGENQHSVINWLG